MKNQLMSKENPTAAAAAGRSDTSYKGVRKRKWGKYVSEIRLPNCRDRIWLGSYDSAEKAARAFDAAMFCLRGSSAKFNFPEDPPHIARAHSLSRSEIQEAAARFANEHPTTVTSTQTGDTNINNHPDIDYCMSETQTDSSSVSVITDGTVQLELEHGDLISDLDMLTTMGSGDYATDYGFFPGEYYSPALTSADVDYGIEIVDKNESFLWNF